MRATYEDLLRAARRIAIEAEQAVADGRMDPIGDWNAVAVATANHLRLLRYEVGGLELTDKPVVQPGGHLGRLAQAIGAGSDLLMSQDPAKATALDDRTSLAVARSEVAAIALSGARLARGMGQGARSAELSAVMRQLKKPIDPDVRYVGLGSLGELRAGGPPEADDEISMLARHAARWERADDAVPPQSLLTRDLRSTTGQLRAACGYVWHLTDQVLASPYSGLKPRQQLDLRVLKAVIRAAESGALAIAESWRRRLSDLGGVTDLPGELAFIELKAALDSVLQPEGELLTASELITKPADGPRFLDVIDELVWSAEQVSRRQAGAVATLIRDGRLFVPRRELVQADITYLRRPLGGRPLQALWARSNLTGPFAELTECLDWSVSHLAVATDISRRLVRGSSARQLDRDEPARRMTSYADIPEISDPGQEPMVLDR
ncbi:hypothetical protein [Kribbella sp. NPDC006257]|uniref:hypothetical protein n=1 Tax=Kribbella sp. NPDC006257 TaxID=3156738 RepID=UPI0033A7140F